MVDNADAPDIAVSTRTEPRFTRDLDFAIAVADDAAAEAATTLTQGETIETCLTRAGHAATVQALGTGLVAITRSDTARAYQAEFGAPASVLANPLFARHLAAIPADTLAWGWMDHDAMRKALPDQLLPLSSLAVLRAMGGGVVGVTYRLSLEDEARARRVEREWTAYSANLPAASLGSRIRYVRTGVDVQCSLTVTRDDMAEAATFLGAFVRAL